MLRNACQYQTLVELLRVRMSDAPSKHAYTYLRDGETDALTWDYGELDRRARAIAAWLQSCGAAGERALLLYPPGLDYLAAFFGCLYAGVVAVPAYPPQRQRGWPRVRAILADSQAAYALTTSGIARVIDRLSVKEDGYGVWRRSSGSIPTTCRRVSTKIGVSRTLQRRRWLFCNTPPAQPAFRRA